jgi:protein subunit release factor A
VRDEVTAHHHEVGLLRVAELDGGHLHAVRRDASDMQIREMGDADVIELLRVHLRAREAPKLDLRRHLPTSLAPRADESSAATRVDLRAADGGATYRFLADSDLSGGGV